MKKNKSDDLIDCCSYIGINSGELIDSGFRELLGLTNSSISNLYCRECRKTNTEMHLVKGLIPRIISQEEIDFYGGNPFTF